MTRAGWWLLEHLSRPLDADEREVVLGDISESRAAAWRAMRDVGGLVIRRQAIQWTGWRPWLALAGLAVPFGVALSLLSRFWSNSTAIYIWFYADNWTSSYLESAGARRDLLQNAAWIAVPYLLLALWSWTAGYALASLSHRTAWANAGVLGLLLFAVSLGSSTMIAAGGGNHEAIFTLALYRVAHPAAVRIALVAVPLVLGLRTGSSGNALGRPRAIACAAAVATLTALTAHSIESAVRFGLASASDGVPLLPAIAWPLRLLPVVLAWPAAFIVATAIRDTAKDKGHTSCAH